MDRSVLLLLVLVSLHGAASGQTTWTVQVGTDSLSPDGNFYSQIESGSTLNTATPLTPNIGTSAPPGWFIANFYPNTLTINVGDTIQFEFNSTRRLALIYSPPGIPPINLRSTSTWTTNALISPTDASLVSSFDGTTTISSGWYSKAERVSTIGSQFFNVTFTTAGLFSFYELSSGYALMNINITVNPTSTLYPDTPTNIIAQAQVLISSHQAQTVAAEINTMKVSGSSQGDGQGSKLLSPQPTSTSMNDGVRSWTIEVGDISTLSSINAVYQRMIPSSLTINLGEIVAFNTATSTSTAALAAASFNQHLLALIGSTTNVTLDWPMNNTLYPTSNPTNYFPSSGLWSTLSSIYTTAYAPSRSGTTWFYHGMIASGLMTATGTTTTARKFSLQFALPGTYPIWSVTQTGEVSMTGVINVLSTCPSRKLPTTAGLIREYPTLSGMNNNLKYCVLGMNGFRQSRLAGFSNYATVSGNYSATSTGMRTLSVTGAPLPTGRNISNIMLSKQQLLAKHLTSDMHTSMAMFLTFDVSALGIPDPSAAAFIAQPVPQCDPVFDVACTGTVTLPFTRMLPVAGTGTDQQTNPTMYANGLTSRLDLSSLYGTVDQVASTTGTVETNGVTPGTIRTFIGGQLCTDCEYQAQPVVPKNLGPWQSAGDARINQSPAVFSFLTIFKKEHNRLAKELAAAHPSWSDEQLYQEARRWVVAFWQKIMTREFLATELGHPLYAYTGYDSRVDPSTFLEFSGAAGRFGHTMITNSIWRRTSEGDQIPQGDIPWNRCIYRTDEVTLPNNPGIEPVMWGLMAQRQGGVGPRLADPLRNMNLGGTFPSVAPSHDLSVINIARGKDIGLPTYNEMRAILGLPVHTSFDTISSNPDIVADLKALYPSVDDIDLFIGGLAEDTVYDGLVGLTFNILIFWQNTRWRDGDRFWYENPDYFTPNETSIVYSTTWSMILARNTELNPNNSNTDLIPQNPFFTLDSDLGYISRTAQPLALSTDTARYDHSVRLNPHYVASWKIHDGNIDIEIRVANLGWAGIGLEPVYAGTMKGADIVICRFLAGIQPTGIVRTGSTNLTFECIDSYAQDVGQPTPDVKLGGVDDILSADAFIDWDYTTSSVGTRVQVFRFTRPLLSSDIGIGPTYGLPNWEAGYDKAFKEGITNIIFAFHPTSEASAYHGPSRSRGTINWYDSSLTTTQVQFTYSEDSTSLRLAIIVVAAIFCLLPIGVLILVFLHHDHPRIRAATLPFCILIPIGVFIAYVGVIMSALEKSTVSCMSFYWLVGTAYCLVFGSIFFKTYRIMKIFALNNLGVKGKKTGKLQLVKITTTTLVLYTLGLTCVMWLLLAIWTGVDPMTPTYKLVSGSSTNFNQVCNSSSDGYLYTWIFLPVVVLLYGSYMSYSVRGVENPIFNESAALGQSIYVTTALVITAMVFGFSLRSFRNTTTLIQAVAVLMSFTYTLATQFVGKFSDVRDSNASKMNTAIQPNSPSRMDHGPPAVGAPIPLSPRQTSTVLVGSSRPKHSSSDHESSGLDRASGVIPPIVESSGRLSQPEPIRPPITGGLPSALPISPSSPSTSSHTRHFSHTRRLSATTLLTVPQSCPSTPAPMPIPDVIPTLIPHVIGTTTRNFNLHLHLVPETSATLVSAITDAFQTHLVLGQATNQSEPNANVTFSQSTPSPSPPLTPMHLTIHRSSPQTPLELSPPTVE